MRVATLEHRAVIVAELRTRHFDVDAMLGSAIYSCSMPLTCSQASWRTDARRRTASCDPAEIRTKTPMETRIEHAESRQSPIHFWVNGDPHWGHRLSRISEGP